MSDRAPGSSDFSRPLQAMKTCHERTRSQCEALRKLAERLKDEGFDAEARKVSADVIRYFDTAARHHHEDEENDLLPRMMAAASLGRGSSLTRMVADIAGEHRVLERTWIELRAALQEVASGDSSALDALTVDRFIKLYQSHIAVEEANVYPLAELLLSNEEFAAIGTSMAARRGVRRG